MASQWTVIMGSVSKMQSMDLRMLLSSVVITCLCLLILLAVGALVHNLAGVEPACQVVQTGATQWLSCE